MSGGQRINCWNQVHLLFFFASNIICAVTPIDLTIKTTTCYTIGRAKDNIWMQYLDQEPLQPYLRLLRRKPFSVQRQNEISSFSRPDRGKDPPCISAIPCCTKHVFTLHSQ